MVLYHVYSEYNIFQAYIHKERFHRSEEVCILIGATRELQIPKLLRGDNKITSSSYVEKCKNIFDNVVLCNNPPDYFDDDICFEDKLNEYYSVIFKKENIDIRDVKAYTFGLLEQFSVFCAYNKIPLSVIELEPGVISELHKIKDFENKFWNSKFKYMSKYGLYSCESDVITERICNFDAQEDDVCLDGYVDFNPYKELYNLDLKCIDKLEEFYGVNQVLDIGADINNTTFLIAGNYILKEVDTFVNHGHFLYANDKQAMAHNLILDLFVKENDVVVINGINNHYDYSKLCGYAKNNIKDIPVELLAYCIRDTGCSVVSALRQDGYCFKNDRCNYLEISTRYYPDWQKYRFFDSAIECDIFMNFLKIINKDGVYKTRYYNVSNIVQKLYNVYFKDAQEFTWVDVKKVLDSSVVFVNDGSFDEKGMDKLPYVMNESKNSIYFFANQRQLSLFFNKKVNYNGKLFSFTINKKAISENSFLNLDERRFWIYCSDINAEQAIKEFVYNRLFTHCGVEVTCRCDSPEFTNELIEKNVKPKSIVGAKSIVLYGDTTGINKYFAKLKEKYSKLYVCNCEKKDADSISLQEMLNMDDVFVLIATDTVKMIQSFSRELKKNKIAFDHCEHCITGNISIPMLIAMERFDYTDDKKNHYIIDSRIKLEDAKKISIDFFKGGSRYFNEIKIGMIRIVSSLKIIIKGDYNKISIGSNTTFQSVTMEMCQNAAINIGERCMFSYGIVLYRDDMHNIYDMESLQRLNYPKDINIGNHVWLGRECMILGGATIGDNCVIGARCVTSSKFPSNVVVAGCPGKVVRKNIVWSRDGYEIGGSNIYDNFDRVAFDYMMESDLYTETD